MNSILIGGIPDIAGEISRKNADNPFRDQTGLFVVGLIESHAIVDLHPWVLATLTVCSNFLPIGINLDDKNTIFQKGFVSFQRIYIVLFSGGDRVSSSVKAFVG